MGWLVHRALWRTVCAAALGDGWFVLINLLTLWRSALEFRYKGV